MKMKYRNNGVIGAILDEYERALNQLIDCIKSLSPAQLKTIVDTETKDEDCRSVQTILTHVVASGYTYALETRKWLGEEIVYREPKILDSINDYIDALNTMFRFNEQLFEDYPNMDICEYDPNKKIHVRWGQRYDVDQLFEHAIMHIYRHLRQIEKFKLLKEW